MLIVLSPSATSLNFISLLPHYILYMAVKQSDNNNNLIIIKVYRPIVCSQFTDVHCD